MMVKFREKINEILLTQERLSYSSKKPDHAKITNTVNI